MDTHLAIAERVTYALKASGGAGWEQHRTSREYAMIAWPPSSSSGLGRRPFKAVARVRIPLGVQNRVRPEQLSKVLWSSWSARRPVKAEVACSSPVRTAMPILG